jgi:hypothetical protein
VSGQIVKKSSEFFGRLEAVASRVPPDVGVRNEGYQRTTSQFKHTFIVASFIIAILRAGLKRQRGRTTSQSRSLPAPLVK